jgi:transcriptional regulator with GAF, ATPase, and Fis domain
MSKKKISKLRDVINQILVGGKARKQQEERLLRLIEINTVLNSELNLKRLLTLIMDSVIELTNAERGFIITGNEDRTSVAVARNIDKEAIQRAESKISSNIIRQVMKEGKAILTDSAMEDETLSSFTSVANLKLRSILCTPVKAKDTIIGCVYIDNRFQTGSFSEDDRLLLDLFSDQAAIAVENARLYEENEEARERLADLNRMLEQKVEHQANEIQSIREELASHHESLKLKYDYSNIIGQSQAMKEVFRLMDLVTDTDYPVLICGDSGTGKELVARAIHYNGPRRDSRFVSENCAAISESLLESELFGYEKGAFTGADKRKTGLFELADGGTLFLDEIGEMELNMQKKLLRVLQEGEIRRVGGRETIKVDVRIISATNADLPDLIGKSRFREDFYYRLKVMTIKLPTLQERREDIPLLVRFFLDKIGEEQGVAPREISPEALRTMMAYPWPGNIRELMNEVQRLALISDRVIGKDAVAELAREDKPNLAASSAYAGKSLEQIEKEAIMAALESTGGNKALAARVLCIPRRTLYNRLKKYDLK